MKINWKTHTKDLYFADLDVGECFVINTPHSQGAVYQKVDLTDCGSRSMYGELELATGKVFPPTLSPVKLVEAQLNINMEKPALYD